MSTALAFASCPKRVIKRTWGERASDVRTGVWLMRLPFGLGKHLLYHNSVHTMTVYLSRSVSEVLKGPYWLHTETVSYDEWTLAKSNSEINRPAAVSLGLCDGWINTVIKWEVATMPPCQLRQADPGSAGNEVEDTSSSCTYRVSLTFGINIYHLGFSLHLYDGIVYWAEAACTVLTMLGFKCDWGNKIIKKEGIPE